MKKTLDLKCRLTLGLCSAALFLMLSGGLWALADEIAPDESVEEDSPISQETSAFIEGADALADSPAQSDPVLGEPTEPVIPSKTDPPVATEPVVPPSDNIQPNTTPAVTIPAATTPAVTIPAATTPAVTTPAVTTPVVTTPAATTPAVSIPASTTPAATTPAATTPAVTIPAATTPVVTTPAATTPVVTTPAVTTPAVTTPAVTTPAMTTPAVTTPAVTTTTVTTTNNNSHDPITKTGELQSVPSFPLSTDPVNGQPAESKPSGGDDPVQPTVSTETPTPTVPGISVDLPDDEDAPDSDGKPGVVEVDQEARRAGLTRLATVFSVAFLISLAAVMLAKFVKIP